MEIFWYVLHKCLFASILILVILGIRVVFKNAPRKSICLLWSLLVIHFVLPPFIETGLPVLPDRIVTEEQAETYEAGYLEPIRVIPEDNYEFVTAVESGIAPVVDEAGKQYVTVRKDSYTNPRKTEIPWTSILFWVWVAGIAGVCISGLLSYLAIRRKTAQSLEIEKGTFICDEIDSPFAMGIIRPQIYLPSGLDHSFHSLICLHEHTHIKRMDTLWKWFGFALLALYWINPLSWIAYHYFCVDLENACDEAATKELNKEGRALYCKALLECGLKLRSVFVFPVYFGETNVLERVKSILHHAQPLKWMKVCVLVMSALMVCGMTLKPQAEQQNEENSYNSMWTGERNYLDTRLGTYAEARRNEANAKWDGETEIPLTCAFLGEIKLCSNEGREIELAVYQQDCQIIDTKYSYIWWAQREGDTFTAARDSRILWQVPGQSDFYSYFGTDNLETFMQKVLKPLLNTAFDVVYNTVKEIDLSEYRIVYPENGEKYFVYDSQPLNRKLQAYAEERRMTSYSKWDGETEIPGQAKCLGEIWLEYGSQQVQYLLYEQKAQLQGKEYSYIWWAAEADQKGKLPYERTFSQAGDSGILWQAPGLSETYSYSGAADLKEFKEKILLPQIRAGLDVVYSSVSDMDLTAYSVIHPEDSAKVFTYQTPVYDKMLAAFAENKRVEANTKWDGKSEVAGKSTCLGEVFLKFNSDQIHYVIYDQQAWLDNKEYHYIWWCHSFREQENEKTCSREYYDCREEGVIWQAPDLSESFAYFGTADLDSFLEEVLMKDIADTYDVIYNTVEGLDLSAYTYPRGENSTTINKEAEVEKVLKTSAVFEDKELAAYAIGKRRESLLKWDFVKEIPVKSEYMGEIVLTGENKQVSYILFRQYADLNGKMYSFIWWAKKEGSDLTKEYTYSEARDTGLLWHPQELDEYFSYYGIANESEFVEKVLKTDLQDPSMKVTLNTVGEIILN